MKKLLVALIIVLSTTAAWSQVLVTANAPEYGNVLKMSASLFTRNTFQMGYERFFNPNTSFYISAGLNFKDSDYEKVWGIRTEAQMRFHVFTVVKPKESHRLYFAPYLLNHFMETESRDYSSSSSFDPWYTNSFDAFSGGMLFGWSYSFANRINLDIYTGGGLRKTFNYEPQYMYSSDGIYDDGYSGILPRLGIDIGFWF